MSSTAVGTVLEGAKRNLKADRLILVNLSDTECLPWLAAMRDAGQPWHEELVDNLAKAKALLQAQPQAHALICYDAPEHQIVKCLAAGRAPSQALANWMNQIEAMLELYREHYQCVTLVAQEALGSKPKALCEHLTSRSGIALGRVAPPKAATPHESDPGQQPQLAMHHLLALKALEHPPAKRLVQELEASSLPLGSSTELLEFLDNTYDILKQSTGSSTEYEQLKTRLEDVQQENDLVIEQLHKTQEELEQYILGNKGSTKRIEKLERDMQQKNNQLASQLAAARQQLKELRSSKSWKVTAPLRKGIRILSGKKGGGA